jgi:hypothetical protein
MTGKLQRLIRRARALESRVGAAFESRAKAIVTAPVPTQPLELVDLAVDELARHVQPAGRGRYAFPFNDVRVTFVAPTSVDQARFEAICAGPPSIDERLVRRLVSAGCEMTSADLDVTLAFTDAADPVWTLPFGLDLARVDRPARTPAPAAAPPRVDLQITLAFVESDDEVSRTVSRRHARIELDPRSQQPRLIDDTSAQGTSVIRQGRIIRVPQGTRGLAMQDGDELVFGRARVTVQLS